MGAWKSIREMEETLTLDEAYALLDAMYRKEERHNHFAAAIQGIDLNEGATDSEFDKVKMKVEADLAGKTEEEYTFDMIGIEYESDDDD